MELQAHMADTRVGPNGLRLRPTCAGCARSSCSAITLLVHQRACQPYRAEVQRNGGASAGALNGSSTTPPLLPPPVTQALTLPNAAVNYTPRVRQPLDVPRGPLPANPSNALNAIIAARNSGAMNARPPADAREAIRRQAIVQSAHSQSRQQSRPRHSQPIVSRPLEPPTAEQCEERPGYRQLFTVVPSEDCCWECNCVDYEHQDWCTQSRVRGGIEDAEDVVEEEGSEYGEQYLSEDDEWDGT